MTLSSIGQFVRETLVEMAARALEGVARRLAGWFLEGIERIASAVATRCRRFADRQRIAGVPEIRLSTRITDTVIEALDALRADLIRRRNHLTAEEALSLFEQQLALPQLAA